MSFIGRRPVITKNKQNIEPHEWYAYKREHPAHYRILKEYIRECTWNGYQPKGSAFDLLPPAVPNHWPKTRDYYIVEPVVSR